MSPRPMTISACSVSTSRAYFVASRDWKPTDVQTDTALCVFEFDNAAATGGVRRAPRTRRVFSGRAMNLFNVEELFKSQN
jgi:hypothetical protein